MANKVLFQSTRGKHVPAADTENEAGGFAYAYPPKHCLAQYLATSCLNHTYYVSAEAQLEMVMDLAQKVEPEFLAKAAVYARVNGYMKDMPALLCAVLSTTEDGRRYLRWIFKKVVNNGKMVRNFCQIVRSGLVGRKSFGSRPKKLIQNWLLDNTPGHVFRNSVGQTPSIADVVKMVHPKPRTPEQSALFAYLIGKEYEAESLPAIVKAFELFKSQPEGEPPPVPFQMLTALDLQPRHWEQIARDAPWQMTRMNLNTFARHGVFKNKELASIVANRLRDKELVRKASVFPYQLLMAFAMAEENPNIPDDVRLALQEAMEIATENVPAYPGRVYVFPDASGSMHSPVTGHRKGATTKVRCVDVAALVAATVLRRNPTAKVIPFGTQAYRVTINPMDSIMTNARLLASINGGGTNCSAPLQVLNEVKADGDLVIYVSDNESWIDRGSTWRGGTGIMKEWSIFKQRNPTAKLVCIDLQPNRSTQATEDIDRLNIGGFSDTVFETINHFINGTLFSDHWVGVIEAIEL